MGKYGRKSETATRMLQLMHFGGNTVKRQFPWQIYAQ